MRLEGGSTMSFTIPKKLLEATKAESLAKLREDSLRRTYSDDVLVDVQMLLAEDLLELKNLSEIAGDRKAARAIDAILLARSGQFGKPLPNFSAAKGVLELFLRQNVIDGWIYVVAADGKAYPELVTAVTYDDGKHHRGHGTPRVTICTAYSGTERSTARNGTGLQTDHHSFSPQELTNRRIGDALAARGIYKETPELREHYLASLERHNKIIRPGFAKQYRFQGMPAYFESENYRRRGESLTNRRVIHDLSPEDITPVAQFSESVLFSDGTGFGSVPEHPIVRVFDLRTYEFFWAHGDYLEPYVYDKSLRTKLVLPQTHRDLLDVLTTDLRAFVGDIVEGKNAGNVILCKGAPGVGKTLTAEVYAELIERPLYMVHAGSLGTTAAQINKSLQELFGRAQRWDCLLLLDEADVFLAQRGQSLEQNAIVAEFLVALERVESLIFLTTNRPHDIDDAIIPRCAAIIDYVVPGSEDAARIWRVMANQYQAELGDGLVADLLALFPAIPPRDIKMLLRLVLRMAKHRGEKPNVELFRQCAMFRAIKMANVATASQPELEPALA